MPLQQIKFLAKLFMILGGGWVLSVAHCEWGKPPFYIINRTTDTIWNASIRGQSVPADSARSAMIIPFITPGDTFTYYVNMDGLTSDGAYGLDYSLGPDTVHTGFGYFSNGAVMYPRTYISIYRDTVLDQYKF